MDLVVVQIECGQNQWNVTERLRAVTHLAAEARVVFLAKQPDVAAQLKQPLEHRGRIILFADQV